MLQTHSFLHRAHPAPPGIRARDSRGQPVVAGPAHDKQLSSGSMRPTATPLFQSIRAHIRTSKPILTQASAAVVNAAAGGDADGSKGSGSRYADFKKLIGAFIWLIMFL